MKTLPFLGMALLGIFSAAHESPMPTVPVSADSGWVKLFNGKDFEGLYVRRGAVLQDPATQTVYKIEGDSIHVPAGGGGLLTTRKTYSRYQMRVKYRYAATGTGQNAGLQYHVEPTDFDATEKSGSQNTQVPYFFGRSFVQSIEFQTYVGNAGAYIGIGNLWARTTTAGGKFSPGGSPFIATPDKGGGGRYINTASPNLPVDYTKWVQCQINVYGADSSIHMINGQVVVKAWKLRKVVRTAGGGADDYAGDADTSAAVPNDMGHIGLQAEGSNIFYRDWEIRLLDSQGNPILTTTLAHPREARRTRALPIGFGSGAMATPNGMVDAVGRRRFPVMDASR